MWWMQILIFDQLKPVRHLCQKRFKIFSADYSHCMYSTLKQGKVYANITIHHYTWCGSTLYLSSSHTHMHGSAFFVRLCLWCIVIKRNSENWIKLLSFFILHSSIFNFTFKTRMILDFAWLVYRTEGIMHRASWNSNPIMWLD